MPPQVGAQALSHATRFPLDFNPSLDRAKAFLPPAGAAANSTPAPGTAPHHIAPSRTEYHAHYAASHPPRGRKNESVPASATPQAQQPEGAAAFTEQPEKPRPNTPPVSAQFASQASVASATSSTTVAAAQRSPKTHKSRQRKRRAEDANSLAVSVTKQASKSAPVALYPVTRAATKTSAAAASFCTALTAESQTSVPKTASSATHADLYQISLPASRE